MGNRAKAAPAAEAFLSQAAYSAHRGVSRKTVTDWKQKGILVLDEKGRVDVAKTDAALDERPSNYRGGVTSAKPKAKRGNKSPPKLQRGAAVVTSADDEGNDAEPIDLSNIDLSDEGVELAGLWSLAQATRVKEIFLALKRRQDYLTAEGKLVEIEEVAVQVEAEYSVIRERLLGIPGKIASSLVGLDRAAIDARILDEISEALSELHDPASIVAGVAAAQGPPDPGAPGAPAAAAP